MAFSASLHLPSFSHLLKNSSSIPHTQGPSSVSFRLSPVNQIIRKRPLSIRVRASIEAPSTSEAIAPIISLTDSALNHLSKMKNERSEELCLRVGVKQGGCSGLSYTMEFESLDNKRPDDSITVYNGFAIVCDPKSLLYLFGMQLDYSDALIGGGFSFKNPNATQTCGCGKSFAAEM
ncbi:uncharacterized protein ycf83 [Impatiens glandulifera]|uniref:uncharacterized protein ycf83 n=1 Tax=Impatiens glandulifera TaxID=253017 RepID=UPI001FB150D2|nr:uncharacterized protein ycf83 [Impatiens glandulifera]